MRDFLNKQLVNIIKSNISPEENMVDIIMSVLSLGKEAAYRRIRGEVPFTFNEVVKLSHRFAFSLDSIAGLSFPDMAVVNTRIFNASQIYDDYKQTLNSHLALFKEMNAATKSKVSLAFNIIPFTFYARFEALSKFKIFRWMHQMDMIPCNIPFSEMENKEDIWNLHQELIAQIDSLQDVCYVLDRNIFSVFVNDINHFIQLGLVNHDDRLLLKKELSALLDLFEKTVRVGGLTPQNNISVYISNIDFDSSYSHYEADDMTSCSLRIYSICTIRTQDNKVCKTHKKWIDSLKRYSVLISGCGEMERVKFISKQRELINLL